MAFTSELKRVSSPGNSDHIALEKVRWAIRQRIRKQLTQLSAELFDTADDFLFSGAQNGQLGENCNSLSAMRELRAKQKIFEELLFDATLREIKATYREQGVLADEFDEAPKSSSHTGFENVEIDIALQRMEAKALKIYQPFINQLKSLQPNAQERSACDIFNAEVLLKALLEAFGEASVVFSVPLEVRIVFSKLFEQHVLLKLENIFLDTINIVTNHRDEKFVDKLYTTSSRFRTSIGTKNKPSAEQLKRHTLIAGRGAQKAQLVEAAADEFIAELVSAFELPKFVEQVIRTKWRGVLIVIGVNRGCASSEWEEAKHTAEQLSHWICERTQLSQEEFGVLTLRLQQGLGLIQAATDEQDKFLLALQGAFNSRSAAELLKMDARVEQPGNSEAGKTRLLDDSAQDAANKEASISPAGESILDERVLDELATLLGGSSSESEAVVPQPDLNNLSNEVDSFGERSAIKFLIDGRMRDCTLTRNKMNPELYTVCTNDTSFRVNRSRIGLAVALRDGALQLPNLEATRLIGGQTVLNPSSMTRH